MASVSDADGLTPAHAPPMTNINPRDLGAFIEDVKAWLRELPTSELAIAHGRDLLLRYPDLKEVGRHRTQPAASIEEYEEAKRRWVAAFEAFVAKVAQGPTDHSTCLLCDKPPLTHGREDGNYCAEHQPTWREMEPLGS